jgi:hypothetical protein
MENDDSVKQYANRKARTEAKRQLAAQYNVSIRTINRQKLCDKPLKSVEIRAKRTEIHAKHREKCEKMASLVVNRKVSAQEGAIQCGISLRQMYRYVALQKGK